MARSEPTVLSVFSIHPTRIGGTEVFARELSRQLAMKGWQSVLGTLTPPAETVARFLAASNVDFETCACASVSVRAVYELTAIIRRHRPRVLHLHYMGILTPYAWLARVLGIEKTFWTDHWSRPEGTSLVRSVVWKRLVSKTLSAPFSRVIAVSDFNRALLSALDVVPNEKISRIYNAVDVSRTDGSADGHELRARYGIPSDRRLIVQVGQLIPEKGVEDLLKAARIVVESEPAAHFMFVGEGAHADACVNRTRALRLASHVTFAGQVEDPFGEGVFAAADLVCQVSRWQEAFGWAIAEAMAFRKPVVATRVGGIPEIVEHGVTGYLAERGDARQIADHILSLLRDPAMSQRMGAAGRAAVEENFNVQKNVATLIQLYGMR